MESHKNKLLNKRITLTSIKSKLINAIHTPKTGAKIKTSNQSSLDFLEQEVCVKTKNVSKNRPCGSRYTQYRCHNMVSAPDSNVASSASANTNTRVVTSVVTSVNTEQSLQTNKNSHQTSYRARRASRRFRRSRRSRRSRRKKTLHIKRRLRVKKIEIKKRRNSI